MVVCAFYSSFLVSFSLKMYGIVDLLPPREKGRLINQYTSLHETLCINLYADGNVLFLLSFSFWSVLHWISFELTDQSLFKVLDSFGLELGMHWLCRDILDYKVRLI